MSNPPERFFRLGETQAHVYALRLGRLAPPNLEPRSRTEWQPGRPYSPAFLLYFEIPGRHFWAVLKTFEAHQPYRACPGCDVRIIQVFCHFLWVIFRTPYAVRNTRHSDLSTCAPSRMSWAAERSVAAQDPWNWALV